MATFGDTCTATSMPPLAAGTRSDKDALVRYHLGGAKAYADAARAIGVAAREAEAGDARGANAPVERRADLDIRREDGVVVTADELGAGGPSDPLALIPADASGEADLASDAHMRGDGHIEHHDRRDARSPEWRPEIRYVARAGALRRESDSRTHHGLSTGLGRCAEEHQQHGDCTPRVPQPSCHSSSNLQSITLPDYPITDYPITVTR